MKLISAILFASLMSAAAHAASPFLEISATNTFRSAERAAVEAAIAQAEAEGKPVLIDMAAAWCGPCLALDKELEARKAEMEPILSQFVTVKLEEMHLEMIFGIDFFAFDIAWFPSMMIYNPATRRWTALNSGGVDFLKMSLTDYLNNPSLGDFYIDRLMNYLRAGRAVYFGAVLDSFIVASTEFDGPKYLATLTELVGFIESSPQLFNAPGDQMRSYLRMAHNRLMERGVATLEEITAADPKAYKGLENDLGTVLNMKFGVPIGRLVRNEGNVAAADQCATLSADLAAAISSASPDDQRAIQLTTDLQCLLLDIQVGRKTGADARAYLATMSEPEQHGLAESLMKVFAATGTDFDLAIQFGTKVKAMYENAFKTRPEMLARVQKATDERLAAYNAGKSHP